MLLETEKEQEWEGKYHTTTLDTLPCQLVYAGSIVLNQEALYATGKKGMLC